MMRTGHCGSTLELLMNFKDKRLWYVVAGVVVLLILFFVFSGPSGEPEAPASPPATTQ